MEVCSSRSTAVFAWRIANGFALQVHVYLALHNYDIQSWILVYFCIGNRQPIDDYLTTAITKMESSFKLFGTEDLIFTTRILMRRSCVSHLCTVMKYSSTVFLMQHPFIFPRPRTLYLYNCTTRYNITVATSVAYYTNND